MLIRGEDLSSAQKAMVLAAFVHRPTTENAERIAKMYPSVRDIWTGIKVTDEQWLSEYAFHFVKDGSRLALNRKWAVPASLVDLAK